MPDALRHTRRRFIFKRVLTYSKREKKVRLFRITFARQKKQITLGLQPKWFKLERPFYRFKLWFCGIVIKYDYGLTGGIFPN